MPRRGIMRSAGLLFEIGLRAIAAHDPLQAAIQVQRQLRDEID